MCTEVVEMRVYSIGSNLRNSNVNHISDLNGSKILSPWFIDLPRQDIRHQHSYRPVKETMETLPVLPRRTGAVHGKYPAHGIIATEN